jgi:hypothetical protein
MQRANTEGNAESEYLHTGHSTAIRIAFGTTAQPAILRAGLLGSGSLQAAPRPRPRYDAGRRAQVHFGRA